jgi:hypothetical protein
MRRFWKRLDTPIKIGLVVGLIGALLTVIGLFTTHFAPLTPRSLLLGILLGGGSWGLVSWAIAAVASDASGDAADDAAGDAESTSASAAASTAESATAAGVESGAADSDE